MTRLRDAYRIDGSKRLAIALRLAQVEAARGDTDRATALLREVTGALPAAQEDATILNGIGARRPTPAHDSRP